MAFMVMGVYLLAKFRYKGRYRRDKVNGQVLDNMESQFKELVQMGVLLDSVKPKVHRSTHGQLPNFKNNKPVWLAALDLRIRWNYFVFNVFVRPSSGSRRVSNRWWVRE